MLFQIAVPNNTKITAIAWNKQDGYIAVGGETGLLKVLKLDSGMNSSNICVDYQYFNFCSR